MKKLFLVSLLLLTLLFLSPPTLAQQQEASLSFDVTAGFDGYAKSSAWTPVRIIAANLGPDVVGEVRVQTTYPGETYSRQLSLPSQSQKEVTLFIPWRSNEFSLEFSSDGKILHRSPHNARTIATDDVLVAVVSTDPALLNFLAGLQNTTGNPLSVAHLSTADLFAETQGLSSLDVLIVNDIDTTGLAAAQQKALRDWVTAGGHLIVGGGPNAALTTAGLAALLPVTGLTPKTLSDLPTLAGYVGETIPDLGPYLAAIPQSTQGQVLVYQENDPLLVSQNVGKGRVSYFALDFGLAPMNGWAGNDAFWENLLDPVEANLPYFATQDAVRSINNTLANISVATLPSPALLIGFLCLYMIVLVPVNYLVLKWFKRREWAWVTIPVLILLFSLVGYIGGFRSRGGQALLRQVSIIQQTNGSATDQSETAAIVDNFLGLYSPSRNRYTLKFSDGMLVQPTDGGSGFNGVQDSGSNPTTIVYGSQTELQNLRTDVGSMATAVAHGQTTPMPITLDLSVERVGSQWQVSGVIDNQSQQALEDAILIAGDYGVQLSRLDRGQTQVNHTLEQLDIGNTYSDLTIWGEFYYQVKGQDVILNDQIIRSVFWPTTSPYRGQQPGTFSTRPPSSEIALLGWQTNAPAETNIEVVGQRVGRENLNLLIVRTEF